MESKDILETFLSERSSFFVEIKYRVFDVQAVNWTHNVEMQNSLLKVGFDDILN